MPTIRPATADDLPTVYTYLCDLEEQRLDYKSFRDVYEANLANPTVHYWLAEMDEEPVGFISCHVQQLLHHAGPVAEIQELYVLLNWRSQGIGQALVGYVMEMARREGWVHLEVTSNRRRVRTHGFYERMGFTQTSLRFVIK